jgi:hypothetical protein
MKALKAMTPSDVASLTLLRIGISLGIASRAEALLESSI